MTKNQFNKLFGGVNGPEYRGAPAPEFNPFMINESTFGDNLRFKEYEINFIDDDTIDMVWVTQRPFEENDLIPFYEEVSRCIHTEIGYTGIIEISVIARDGEEYGYAKNVLRP